MDINQLEKFLDGMDSRYRAVIVASKRANQLQQGLRPLFEGKSTKVTTMALEELINKKVTYKIQDEINQEPEEKSETTQKKSSQQDQDSIDSDNE